MYGEALTSYALFPLYIPSQTVEADIGRCMSSPVYLITLEQDFSAEALLAFEQDHSLM